MEKCRISLVLGILADASRLPPLLIFKGKPNTIIKSDDFSASSQSIINYENNKNSYIISRIYNGI